MSEHYGSLKEKLAALAKKEGWGSAKDSGLKRFLRTRVTPVTSGMANYANKQHLKSVLNLKRKTPKPAIAVKGFRKQASVKDKLAEKQLGWGSARDSAEKRFLREHVTPLLTGKVLGGMESMVGTDRARIKAMLRRRRITEHFQKARSTTKKPFKGKKGWGHAEDSLLKKLLR